MLKKNTLAYAIATLTLLASANVRSQTTSVDLSGLAKPVKVSRDARSIPYISAANDADLYYVQGYVTASDRLWQMDLMRRLPRGETAEIFGKQTLEEDKRWRRLGFAKIVDESLVHLSPELRAALESYARGVNAYIASISPEGLPVEFKILQYKPRPWTPSDSLIIGKILADALSSTWRTDLTKASLMASLPREKFDALANVRTDQDVIVFGRDTPGPLGPQASSLLPRSPHISSPYGSKSSLGSEASQPHGAKVTLSLLALADSLETVRDSSLARGGFYAEQLAASNNWGRYR